MTETFVVGAGITVVGGGAGATGVPAPESNALRSASRNLASSESGFAGAVAGGGVCVTTWAETTASDEMRAQSFFVNRIGRGDCGILSGSSNNRWVYAWGLLFHHAMKAECREVGEGSEEEPLVSTH